MRFKSYKALSNKMSKDSHKKFKEEMKSKETEESREKAPRELDDKLKEAWASSVWSIRTWWYSFSYGANNPIYGYLWLSKYVGINKEETATWEAFMEHYDLVEAIYMRWEFAPG